MIVAMDPHVPVSVQPWLDASARQAEAPVPPADREEQIALAWALKDACYEAWSAAPARAALAADALAALKAASGDPQVAALADWTSAIVALLRGEMADAIDALESARRGLMALGLKSVAAQTEVPRVMALAMLGRHREALRRARAAYAVLVAAGDMRTAGKLCINLGSIALRRDQYAEAARHYRTAGALMARVGDREASVMADIGSADALTWLGDFDEAERLYDRARMRAQTHGLLVLQALVDGSIGWLELSRGRYRQALAALEAACRQFRALDMPQRLAIAEQHLGDAYLEVRLLPEAIALYETAIAAFTRLDAPDDLAWTYAQLGRALTLAGDLQRAAKALEASAAGYAALGNRAGTGAVRLWQAELALHQGDTKGVLDLADEAIRELDATGLERWRDMARTVRAEAHLAVGRARDAAQIFAEVLTRQTPRDGDATRVRCETGLGLAAKALGSLDEASARFEQAIHLAEQQRAALPNGEMRVAFQAQVMRPYEALLALRLASKDPRQPDDVLALLERCRARSLLELAGAPPETADGDERLAKLRDRVRWLHRHAQRVDAAPASTEGLRAKLGALERELLEHVRRRRIVRAVDDAGGTGAEPIDRDALSRALDDDAVVIEYGQSGGSLFACTVTRKGVALWRDLATEAAWTDAVHKARFQIETLRHGGDRLHRHAEVLIRRAQRHLQALYALLWRPFEHELASARTVLIVPHGALHYVPFASLHDGQSYLVERHALCQAPSLALALRRWKVLDGHVRRVSALGAGNGLAHVEDEVKSVGAMFADARVHVGAEATSLALRDAAATSDLIHIASHASFRPDSPMFSTIDLYDGPLTLLDLQALALRPCTVVLSGCDTGQNALAPGDELTGLVQTFIRCGANRVVASQWPVDDAASAGLMANFYRALRVGQRPSAALAKAQRDAIGEGMHPFHWAAFAVHGGP